jgi:hypothetical protein
MPAPAQEGGWRPPVLRPPGPFDPNRCRFTPARDLEGGDRPPSRRSRQREGASRPPSSASAHPKGADRPPSSASTHPEGGDCPPDSAFVESEGTDRPPTSAFVHPEGGDRPPTVASVEPEGGDRPPGLSPSEIEGAHRLLDRAGAKGELHRPASGHERRSRDRGPTTPGPQGAPEHGPAAWIGAHRPGAYTVFGSRISSPSAPDTGCLSPEARREKFRSSCSGMLGTRVGSYLTSIHSPPILSKCLIASSFDAQCLIRKGCLYGPV